MIVLDNGHSVQYREFNAGHFIMILFQTFFFKNPAFWRLKILMYMPPLVFFAPIFPFKLSNVIILMTKKMQELLKYNVLNFWVKQSPLNFQSKN